MAFDCRAPENAKIKDKMLAASSRDALRRSLVGIAVEVQATAYDEVARETGTSLTRTQSATSVILTDICAAVIDKAKRTAN